jgi:IS605 OrfB family transposase
VAWHFPKLSVPGGMMSVTGVAADLHHQCRNPRAPDRHQARVGVDLGLKTLAVVTVEDLNAAGMLKNRRLAKAVSDASFAELRRQLQYKCAWYGTELVVADRWFPSSKTCSGYGHVQPTPLHVRTYHCSECGLVLDRDVNAAINLACYQPN